MYIQARGLEAWIYRCVLTPLGSPTDLQKRLFDHSVRRTVGGPAGCTSGVWGMGGWVGGRAIPVYYPAARGGSILTAERAPGSPTGAGVGGQYGAGRAMVLHPPSGPGRDPGPSLVQDLRFSAFWANKGEI